MKSFLQLKFLPLNPGFALFLLRVWLGLSMLSLHGLGKLANVLNGRFVFSDNLHIGSAPTLILATSVEVLGSIFLVIGFMARAAALALAVSMLLAFGFWHSWEPAGQGELAFIYLAGFLTIVLAGTGKYGIDRG